MNHRHENMARVWGPSYHHIWYLTSGWRIAVWTVDCHWWTAGRKTGVETGLRPSGQTHGCAKPSSQYWDSLSGVQVKRSQLRWFRHLVKILPAFHWMFSSHTEPRGEPRVDPETAGEIVILSSGLRIPQDPLAQLESMTGIILHCDPASDKWRAIDEWKHSK